MTTGSQDSGAQVQAVEEIHAAYERIVGQLRGVIVGLDDVIEQLTIALLCHGHCILEGVPGLAKTMLVSSLGRALGLKFGRIQFTPDLMPADITGTDVLEEDHTTGRRAFRFVPGPLFANLLLADEVNRTPPKTQSALLEAMQERQLTVGGNTYPLPHPFFVLATQNPIEQEGTYPLPEAQLDRFMLKIQVGYPSELEEIEIAKRQTTEYAATVTEVLSGADIERIQKIIPRVLVGEHVYRFAVGLARMTRPNEGAMPSGLENLIAWGAGPRASIYLLLAAKARAVLHGRCHATTEDVVAMAGPVLRHRVIPSFSAEAAGRTADDLIVEILRSAKSLLPAMAKA